VTAAPRNPGASSREQIYARRWLILFVLCFSLLVIVLDNTILNVAIPTIVRDLDASNSQLQWMVDSYVLVFAGLLLTAGSLGDRFGRRGALQVGFILFGLGSVASALADTADQLIATRAAMGIGAAFIMPATLSIITNVFPADERGRAIGFWAGTAGVGVALGPLAGGFLLEHYYWGSIFLVNVPIVIFGLVCGWFVIPTSKDPAAPKLDLVGAGLSIAGLTALLYGIIEAPESGWTSAPILTAFAIAILLLSTFVAWERRSEHPMLSMRFFKNPRFTAASAAIAMVFFALFGSIFLLTQYFQFVLDYSPLQAGVRLLPFAVTMMVAAPTSAHLAKRFGTKLVVASGLLLVGLSMLLFLGLEPDSSYGDIVWRLILMSTGMGLTMAPSTESIMGSLPLSKAGVGSAVNDTVRQVGGALGVAVVGSALSSIYAQRIDDALRGSLVPPEGQEAARRSLGGAIGVAQQVREMGVPGATELAASLTNAAKAAFVDAMHIGVLVAAGVAILGSVIAFVWLPARARAEDVADQQTAFARAELD